MKFKNLSQEQIKEIVEQLDCGFRCFWHKTDGELLFFPDTLKQYDMDTEAWSEEMEKFDNNFDEYKFAIDNSGEYRQKWFEFKDRKLQEWVTDRFNEIVGLEKYSEGEIN